MCCSRIAVLAAVAHVVGCLASEGPVVITGATGRSGALTYNLLKEKKADVRGFVRNATKAKELLGCTACDESEGIFVGDITQAASLDAVMKGAGSLIIATSAVPICDPFPKCSFPKGAEPIEVDWKGAKAQLSSFAMATEGKGQVVLISTMGTTSPEKPKDPFDHIGFYKLNFEAALEASGLPYTIVKPCGLGLGKPGLKEIITGHDDEIAPNPPVIERADVARVIAAAVMSPKDSIGLRFDLCAQAGTPTKDEDLIKVLHSARYPWETENLVNV